MLYHSPLLDPLVMAAQAATQQPVLYCDKKSYTAKDLLTASLHLAEQLLDQGMQKDDMVVIAIAPGFHFVTVMYATIMIRARVAIIDPEMGRELYKVKFQQLEPKWAFVDTRLLLLQEHPLLRLAYFKLAARPVYFPRRKGLRVIGCGPRLPLFQHYTPIQKLIKAAHRESSLMPDPGNHQYLITYTSGTIQEPKGVLHSFSALSESINLLSKVVANKPADIMATYLPHFALMGIAAQLPIVVYDAGLSAEKKIAFFIQNKISILFGPPSDFMPLIRHCEQSQSTLPACLKHIMLGSAPVHQSFLKRLQAIAPVGLRITITYGMTEHLLVSTADGNQKMHYKGEGDYLGKPIEGVEIKIAGNGELLVKSPQLYTRYFHLSSRDEFHASGDLARIDQDGNILLMGRKKEMIIRGNTNIYPALYEGTIKKIPGIDEAAMVGIYNDEREDEDVFLAVEASSTITERYVMEHISYGDFQIEKNAWPDKIVFMDIPRKGRQHKIDRQQIIERIKASGL